jgi:hypothetical protein
MLLLVPALSGVALGQEARPPGFSPGPEISSADYERIRHELHIKSQPWANIPWKTSVSQARELAFKSNKPIFFVVNTGNCLGFV